MINSKSDGKKEYRLKKGVRTMNSSLNFLRIYCTQRPFQKEKSPTITNVQHFD